MFTSVKQNAKKVTTQTPSKFGEPHTFGNGNNNQNCMHEEIKSELH